jgi:hypothetical protein
MSGALLVSYAVPSASVRAGDVREGRTVSSVSLPVAALVVIGIILAVLGLLVGGGINLVIIGLVTIAVGGVLQVMGSRRA